MADFSPDDLVTQAKALYGETVLRERVAPGADDATADKELGRIARTVLSRVAAAAESSVGWPLPGTWPEGSLDSDGDDISGIGYRELWPDDLLQRALDLFQFRTYSGLEVAPDRVTKLGSTTEQFFLNLAKGIIGLGLGVDTDTSSPEPLAARDRQGRNHMADGAVDNERVADSFTGAGWDWQY